MGSGGLCRQGAAAAGSHDPSGSVCGSLPAGVVCALRRESGVCGGVRPGSDAHAAGIRIPSGASGAEQRGAGSEPAGSAPRLYPPPDRSPWLVTRRAGQRRGSGGSAGRIPAPAPGRQHPAGSTQGGQGRAGIPPLAHHPAGGQLPGGAGAVDGLAAADAARRDRRTDLGSGGFCAEPSASAGGGRCPWAAACGVCSRRRLPGGKIRRKSGCSHLLPPGGPWSAPS